MSKLPHQRIMMALQLCIVASFIGMALFIYNDWRTHQTHAAALSPWQATPPKTANSSGGQGVSGTVQVNPDGSIKQQ